MDITQQLADVEPDVLDALDEWQLASNTLVIVTSDNGCSPAAGITERTAAA